jgi:hypothetical protein
MELFSKLPDVLLQQIINYTDIIVYRHGKYINRLTKDDVRYILLSKIPKPLKLGSRLILMKLVNYKYDNPIGYFIMYKFESDSSIKISIKFFKKLNTGVYVEKSYTTYIQDMNNNMSKVIPYSM